MDVQQLRAFTATAQLENVSKAAESLHISQSSLSKQIRKLETELGMPLFERKGRKVLLNKAGMSFYDASSRILQELHAAEENLRLLSRDQYYHIRIGACAMPEDFPDCIAAFAKKHPETEFTLNSLIDFGKHSEINEYDALICPDNFQYEKLSGSVLFEEGYYFAVSAENALASEKVFASGMLKEQPVVFIKQKELTPEFPYRVCTALGMDPKTVYFTDTRETHRKMIAAGMACGFVPKTEAGPYEKDKGIRLLRILDSRFTRPMKICFLREKQLSKLGLCFRDFVLEYYGLT